MSKKTRKNLHSGQLVYFDAFCFGLIGEENEITPWVSIVIEPRNLLQNAKIKVQKTGKIYSHVPYLYLHEITG